MIVYFLSLIHLLVLTIGIGYFISKISKLTLADDSLISTLVKYSLLGFVLLLPVLGFLSVFFAISICVNIILLLLALAGILRFVKDNSAITNWKPSKYNIIPLVIYMLFQLALLYHASVTSTIWDTWMYHAQAIQWIEKYPVIPGLANLNPHYGVTSSVFLLQALVSYRELLGFSIFPLTFYLSSLLLLYMTDKANRLFTSGKFLSILIIFLFYFIFYYYFRHWISSASPDPASFLLISFIVMLMFEDRNDTFNQLLLILLSLSLVTIKLSNVFLFIFVLAFLVPYFKQMIKPGWVIFLAVFVLLPWLIRNYYLSGYLFYPATFRLFFVPDWTVPPETLEYFRKGIYAWARMPFSDYDAVLNLPLFQWVQVWLRSFGILTIVLIFMCAISPLLILYLKVTRHVFPKKLILFYLLSFVSVIYWFMTAPVPRVSLGFITVAALFPLIIISQSFTLGINKRIHNTFVTLLLVFSLFILSYNKLNFPYPEGIFKFSWVKPVQPPKTTFIQKKVDNIIIKEIAPGFGNRCFDETIPCAYRVDPMLQLRGPNISDGFRISQTR